MDYFNYKQGKLFAENVPIETIAEQLGTPVYIYSKATFLEHLRKIQHAYNAIDTMVCYSIKACGNINILKLMAKVGSGFDIVSGGELYRAIQAGADPAKIVYAGVGKTDKEIIEAIEGKIVFQRCKLAKPDCEHPGGCALCGLYEQAQDGVKDVFSRTTLRALVDQQGIAAAAPSRARRPRRRRPPACAPASRP